VYAAVGLDVVQYAMASQQAQRRLSLLKFALHSLPRAYGRVFLQRMVLHHPLRTARGVWAYWQTSGAGSTEQRALSDASEASWLDIAVRDSERLVVGTGFCQKPVCTANHAHDCPAGRFDHDCLYLADLDLGDPPGRLYPACAGCPIRVLGHTALRAGASLAILTSALDIAHDILLPSLEEQRFKHILFAICPYSLEPMSLALLICGLDGYIFSYKAGDCANYAQWLRADRGDKPEQTTLSAPNATSLLYLLETIAAGRARLGLAQPTGYQQEDGVFRPV
jgi:hypothetical protein